MGISFRSGAFFLLVVTGSLNSTRLAEGRKNHHRTINSDPTFSRWPNRTSIPYYLDLNYTSAEVTLIRKGLAKFQADMQGCLTFVEVPAGDPRFKIHVTPFNDTGDFQSFCYTYQGQTNPLVNNGATEQRLIITRGRYGCLDGSLRSIMKYWAIVVGKRNEHQRGDREKCIRVHQENVVIKHSYRLYNTSEANWALRPYDFCSITHNEPSDYAAEGTVAFDILTDPKAVSRSAQISLYDCQLISIMYNCPTTRCQTLDCAAARAAALLTTTPIPALGSITSSSTLSSGTFAGLTTQSSASTIAHRLPHPQPSSISRLRVQPQNSLPLPPPAQQLQRLPLCQLLLVLPLHLPRPLPRKPFCDIINAVAWGNVSPILPFFDFTAQPLPQRPRPQVPRLPLLLPPVAQAWHRLLLLLSRQPLRCPLPLPPQLPPVPPPRFRLPPPSSPRPLTPLLPPRAAWQAPP
ncbi:hypothetical protein RvY_01340-1 [Ramazzottius varieornatus]|uniref:Metalloendopeptidase n=1 Tax=Ramazzottius varieornatus TaxID=947166 RepID=A0A1D1UJY2_RAMVA|nr:hypothetical protein RvY_01340-1 [Ramazzottius varieornatus]